MLIRSLFESQHGEIQQLFFDTLLSSSDLRKNEKIQYIYYRTKDGVMSTYITPLPKSSNSLIVNLMSLPFIVSCVFKYGLYSLIHRAFRVFRWISLFMVAKNANMFPGDLSFTLGQMHFHWAFPEMLSKSTLYMSASLAIFKYTFFIEMRICHYSEM